MGLCIFCSSIPLKLFSTARDKQCTIDHHPSIPDLQASSTAGCELCKLLVHAIKNQTEGGEYDHAFGPWSTTGSITVRSTKFDSQHVQIDHRQAGRFRGKLVPPEWCKDPTSEYWLDDTDSRRRTNLRLRSDTGQGDTSHQILARKLQDQSC